MPSRTETLWLKWPLILVLFACSCAVARAASDGKKQFETPPPNTNSIKWEESQRLRKAREETYRKRIAISPEAMSPDAPRNASLNAGNNPLKMTEAVPPPAAPGGTQKMVFYLVAAAVAGFFVLRRYAPEFLADVWQLNPLATAPEPEPQLAPVENVRAESESFDKFLTAFKGGPSAPPEDAKASDLDLVKAFYGSAAGVIARQRSLLQEIALEAGGLARQKMLSQLRAEMNLLKEVADFPDALPVWQMAVAMEGLLKQLTDKMGNVTPSALRTVNSGVELLADLCAMGLQPQLLTDRPLKFLVVDDELISRHALSFALGKAFTKPDVVMDAEAALAWTYEHTYDAIFLDVQMPGMDGFELCVKIHQHALNRSTPVVFVTGQSDFDARARSTISGGNDLMSKPFLTFEVTVKALTLALHGRLHGRLGKPVNGLDPANPLPEAVMEPTRPVASLELAPRAMAPVPEELIQAFLARVASHIQPLRELCGQLTATADMEARQALLADGFLHINSLIVKDGGEMQHPAYRMTEALEGLFRKLMEDAKYSSASTFATLTAAVEVLHDLCGPGVKTDLITHPPIEILVVDDDLLARRMIAGVLQTAFRKPESAESGEAALVLAAEKPFDIIFMDVVMPGMDGYEACAKIRHTIANSKTPVVFVTGQQEGGVREKVSQAGGNDLLGKPFLTAEVNVKALTYALRGRLQRGKTLQHS
jgi:CheY-like chemotaxis protein